MGVRRSRRRARPDQRARGREPDSGVPAPAGQAELNLTVRPAAPADLGQVSDIFAWYALHSVATFECAARTRASWSQQAAELAELGLPFLVAEIDGAIVGYAYAGPWRRKPAYRSTAEDSVFVAPGRTGLGVGRRLLTELLVSCANARLRQVIAVIADSGDPASVALHLACGFSHAGRLTAVGFKHGRWIDTVLMQRTLPPAD